MRSLAFIAILMMVTVAACAEVDDPGSVDTTRTDSAVVLAQDGTEFVVDVSHPGPLTQEAINGIAASIEVVDTGETPFTPNVDIIIDAEEVDLLGNLEDRGVSITVRPRGRMAVIDEYSWRFVANPTHHVDACPGM